MTKGMWPPAILFRMYIAIKLLMAHKEAGNLKDSTFRERARRHAMP